MDAAAVARLQVELASIDAALKRLHWDLQRAERLQANGPRPRARNGGDAVRVRVR